MILKFKLEIMKRENVPGEEADTVNDVRIGEIWGEGTRGSKEARIQMGLWRIRKNIKRSFIFIVSFNDVCMKTCEDRWNMKRNTHVHALHTVTRVRVCEPLESECVFLYLWVFTHALFFLASKQ